MTLPQLPYAHGGPVAGGRLRATPEDFRVDEDLGFAPEGAGEHLFVQIRKREQNTDWVARGLARWADVRPLDVSFAGMKDRHAVTTQWFSLTLPGRADPDPKLLELEGVELLTMTRHSRKLRRGVLRGNRFQLRVRELAGEAGALAARLETMQRQGVPNYFGPQRFGRDGSNLGRAAALFSGEWRERDRNKRGIYISAARSHLFNRVLATRVAAGNWNQLLPGECPMLDGTGSFFRAEVIDETLRQRLASGDIHPSGPLWGRGEPPSTGEVLALELAALAEEGVFKAGLEAEGLKQERRPLRLPLRDLSWQLEAPDQLVVSFWLPAGSYATAVMRELVATAESLD